MDILVEDVIWERVKPQNKPKGSGLLCGSCIMKRLETLFGYSVFNLSSVGKKIKEKRRTTDEHQSND